MNINNLAFLKTTQNKGAFEASENGVENAAQGMSEEFLALLAQEINPENADADIMAILKTMPVDQVNELVKTFSEEVNAKSTTQDDIVTKFLSQFETKESLVKAMEENPKLADIVKNANHRIIEQNPILAKILNQDETKSEGKSKENGLIPLKSNTDDFLQLKSQSAKSQSVNNLKNINAFQSQNPGAESMIKANLDTIESDILTAAPVVVSEEESLANMKTVFSMKVDTTNMKNSDMSSNKVLNMDSLQNVENADEMITKIQDYIIQSKVSNEKSVEMSFIHKDLGQINLHVEKMNNNQIQISIMSSSKEGAKFFKDNQAMLSASLASSGLEVSHLKLETTASSSSSFDSDQREEHPSDFSKENEQRQSQSDHKRRHELWQLLSEGQVA